MAIHTSRKRAWLRDELILALALYRRHGRNPPYDDLLRVSALLRAIPIEEHLASESPNFRNVRSVALKVSNFVALDPTQSVAGMTRGGLGDKEVWDEFAEAQSRLFRTSDAIERHIDDQPRAVPDEGSTFEAIEGRLLVRAHLVRERSAEIALRKKLAEGNAELRCEACGFDFETHYGARGVGFIECHHLTPLCELDPGTRTKFSDLALVCANCHRMIHRWRPWLTLGELQQLLTRPSAAAAD